MQNVDLFRHKLAFIINSNHALFFAGIDNGLAWYQQHLLALGIQFEIGIHAWLEKLILVRNLEADKPLTINLLYNTSDLHKKLAIAASSLWKKNIGVNVKLVNQEWKTFLDTRHQGTFDVARAGWCADYNEPTSFLNTMLSNSSMNTAHYKSPAFDSIMAETLKVTDEAQRTALYTKAEQQLDKDSAIVPVYYYVNARLVKPWVGGYTGKDPLDNTYTRNMYIVKH